MSGANMYTPGVGVGEAAAVTVVANCFPDAGEKHADKNICQVSISGVANLGRLEKTRSPE